MNKRRILTVAACLFIAGFAAFAQSTMTDQQVLDYVKTGVKEGKSQDEMIADLALKGVDRAQAERVRALYESQNQAETQTQEVSRAHTLTETQSAPADVTADESNEIYGRNIFRNRNLSFTPSENLPTPRNYRLGPGDEVIIDIFGANQSTLRSIISPEGSINVDVLGPIYLNGMTIDEANAYLKRKLAGIYAGLNRSNAGTNIRLSLGQIRTIQVNILDNVDSPGSYRLSSLSTVFHALYMAGGPSGVGTLRNIKVSRGGKIAGTVDVYDYLINGSSASDMRLEEGDVILLPAYEMMVKATGLVKRPMRYEMKAGETLADLLKYAGGFDTGAYTESVTVTRQNSSSYYVRTVPKDQFATFLLEDGDEVNVSKLNGFFDNKISITGAVYQPGPYELSSRVHTVKQLVEQAGGLLPEAFTGRVVIHREHEDRTLEIISLNLGEILAGNAPDFELQKNDELQIVSIPDLQETRTMTISGLVVNPGAYPFAENTTVEDLIIIAGGLLDGASTTRVDVSRAVKDSKGQVVPNKTATVYSFAIKDGLVDDGVKGFILEPYDEVIVHKSPAYNIQRHFSVSGEVNFPGTFTMSNHQERISDLISIAGGVTDFAHLEGARLFRRYSPEEILRAQNEKQILLAQGDSTSVDLVSVPESYSVTINLREALAHPGGKDDIVLFEGDNITIPQINEIVKVSGAVMMPAAFAYNPNYTAGKYIRMSGGLADKAKLGHAYVVNTDGSARPYSSGMKLKAGDEIVVPKKEPKEHNAAAWSNVATITSMIASLTTALTYVFLIIRYQK
ncbi:MAG: SLBB domain-containing protein [Bacteroidales bacterium]|nr:SLBB domain-containing protein [Bacteroidales bacterium]